LVSNETEGREWVAAWRASGKGLSSWCRENDVAWYSLRHWSRKCETGVAKNLPSLVEIRFAQPATPSVYRIEFRCGRTLEITDGFDETSVRRIVGVLENA